MPKIAKVSSIIARFNEGSKAFEKAMRCSKNEDWNGFEESLRSCAISVIGSLEWTIKLYLRHFCRTRLSKEDWPRLKQPDFHTLMQLIKKYGEPEPSQTTVELLFSYREDLRNAAEHDAAIPPVKTLSEAIVAVRGLILLYLPIEDEELRPITRLESIKSDTLQRSLSNYSDTLSLKALISTEPAICGRDVELKQIETLLALVKTERQGRIILIGGGSGIGKTRLCQEICRIADNHGFDIFASVCEPFHEGMTFFPMWEITRQLTAERPITELIDDCYGSQSTEAFAAACIETSVSNPLQRRDAFVATFANLIYGRFKKRSGKDSNAILVFIDDMERVDSGSADALLCILVRFTEGPVIVLGAYRSDMEHLRESTPFRAILSTCKRRLDASLILQITHLPKEFMGEISQIILGAPCAFPQAFYDKLYEETEGNPLFIRETLRKLTRTTPGIEAPIQKINESWRIATDVRLWEIPSSVEDANCNQAGLFG